MRGEQNQQSQWHVAFFSPGGDLSACMSSRQISPLTIWYPQCTPAEMWVTPAWASALFIYFFFIFSCLFLLPEAPLDGTVQLFVKCCSEQWCRASVFVTRLPGSTAVFWGAFECLISLLCYPSFLLIFVFHSQLCSEKMALWPVSRSINDKALCRRNLQLDQLCLSVVCLHKFWPWWIKFFFFMIFTNVALNFKIMDRDTRKTLNVKLNNLGAASGKIPKAVLQVWSRSLH